MAAKTKIQHFRGTAARWTEINPVLAAGELGLETDTNKIKFGDGTSTWSALSYAGGETGPIALDSLSDVTAPTPATDDILKWNGTAWVNAALPSGLPTQTGNAGELLVTNGTDASWSNTVQANAAATPALVVKGAASQSTNLQEWQDSTGAIKSKVTSSGSLYAGNSALFAGSGTLSIVTSTDSTSISARAYPGQTQPLQDWANSSGVSVASMSASGLLTAQPATPSNTNSADNVGYVGMPQVAQSQLNQELYSSMAGKHYYITTSNSTVLVPSSASVPLEIGTTFVFINMSGANATINSTTGGDTMYLAGAGTTGNRVLANYGMATLVKITATSWLISGNGLS